MAVEVQLKYQFFCKTFPYFPPELISLTSSHVVYTSAVALISFFLLVLLCTCQSLLQDYKLIEGNHVLFIFAAPQYQVQFLAQS